MRFRSLIRLASRRVVRTTVLALAMYSLNAAFSIPVHAQIGDPLVFYWEIQINGLQAPDGVQVEILNDQGNPVCADPGIECRLRPAGANVVTTVSSFDLGSILFNISTNTDQPNNVGETIDLLIADPWDDTDFLTLRLLRGGTTIATYVYSEPPRVTPSGTSFFRPSTSHGGTPDVVIKVAPDPIDSALLKVESRVPGSTVTFESIFGDRFVSGYDRAPCADSSCSSLYSGGVFLARVGEVPTATRRAFTFSQNYDTVIMPGWNPVWDLPGLVAEFQPGRQLVVSAASKGIPAAVLDASGVAFTASNTAQGWDGVRFLAGSSGTWTGVTVGRVVGGPSIYPGFGPTVNAFIGVVDASPTFTNVTLQDPVGSVAVDGFYVTDTAAPADSVFIVTPLITNLTGSGVVVNGAGRVDLFGGTISSAVGAGVATGGTGATAYLRRATTGDERGPQIFNNVGAGVVVGSGSVARFGNPGASPGYGYTSVRNNTGRGLTATAGGIIYAGSGTAAAGTYQRNQVLNNLPSSSTGNALATGTGSAVYARCNWWGQNVTAPLRTGQTSGGLLDASYYLTADPYTTSNPPCAAVTMIELGRGVAGGAPRSLALGRGTPESEATALDRLADAMSASTPSDRAVRLASLVSDLPETEAAAAALGETAGLAGQAGAPPAAGELLETATLSAYRALRIAAWQGLVASRRATGDVQGALAAADALALEGGLAAVPAEVARVYLYSEVGDLVAALAALSNLEALAPTSVEFELAQAFLGGEAAAGVTPPSAEARGTAGKASAEQPTDGALTLAVWPNPSASSASVTVTIAEPSSIVVTVYDLLGRAVATPLGGTLAAGAHLTALDVSALPPGVYVVRAVMNQGSGSAVQTARLTVAR